MHIAVIQQPCVAADRRTARAIERSQERPLGGCDETRLRILDGGQQIPHQDIVGAEPLSR